MKTKTNKTNKTSTPAVVVKTTVDKEDRKTEADLIKQLRIASEKKDRKAGKKIRRALRAIGHRGGLRSVAA